MRLKLTLELKGHERVIPINYQYECAAAIYHVIRYGDSGFSEWLHQQGYTTGNQRFKLFTFSNFQNTRFRIAGDRFTFLNTSTELVVSFHVEEAVQHFVNGLFRESRFSIGDKVSQVDFEVRAVENIAPPPLTETMRFRCLSPVCLSEVIEHNGRQSTRYLHPDDSGYKNRFFDNLINRYRTVNPSVKADFEQESFDFTVLSEPKSRLLTIKAGTPQETRVRGFMFDFECRADTELLNLGYDAGMGEKNSLGFGCVDVMDSIARR